MLHDTDDAGYKPHILVMVWRVLQGTEIAAIRLEYDGPGPFRLYVKLAPPDADGAADEYRSNDIEDAVVLRHLGIMKVGGQGIFDGFYSLNLDKTTRAAAPPASSSAT